MPNERHTATVVGPAMVVSGTLKGDEDVEVRGVVHGRIEINGTLTIVQGARVEADVSAKKIDVHGFFSCSVVMADSVSIHRGGEVHGDLRAPRVFLADGGRLRGRVDTASDREALIDQVLGQLGASESLELFAEPKWSKHRGGLK
jgi:cytoskeletal protein CcmA (bactofilin family)